MLSVKMIFFFFHTIAFKGTITLNGNQFEITSFCELMWLLITE